MVHLEEGRRERGKYRRGGRRGEREGEKKERRGEGGDTTTYLILSHPYLGIEPLLVLIPKWRVTHQQNIENYTWSGSEEKWSQCSE